MTVRKIGAAVEWLGNALAICGGVMMALIFLVVLVNGRWPAFLSEVQIRFRIVGHFVGWFAFPVEVLIFIGPGLLLAGLGRLIIGTQPPTT